MICVYIWNPSYGESETVEWFGGRKYSQSVGIFVANGEGRAVWYLISCILNNIVLT